MLDEIIKNKSDEIKSLELIKDEMLSSINNLHLGNSNFLNTLINKRNNNAIAVIAEIKRRSPSKGYLDENLNILNLVDEYENSGASCISVLTEKNYFKGSIEDLILVKKITNLPVLRKDFIIEDAQVIQSKLIGADCILLIVAALTKEKIFSLLSLSKELGLDVLLEVHDEQELDIALQTDCKLIGVNNRNLKNFDVSLNTSIELSKKVLNDDIILVSESGISKNSDIELLKNYNFNTFLIGETLIKSKNPGSTLNTLIGAS